MQNDDHLQLIIKQFLCQTPLKVIAWNNFSDLSSRVEELVEKTVRSEQVLKYPLSVSYQKAFLKSLLQRLEKQDSAVPDCVYEEYARLVALRETDSFKHYSALKGGQTFILKENINIISEGTTGLRTWQASLALSEWILANPAVFARKRVLELGSGVGLTGLVLTLCSPQSVLLTDCHPSVLTVLQDNIRLNLNCSDLKSECDISVRNLPWEDVSPEVCQKLGQLHVIVAADVVYDCSIFEPLISAVNCVFENCGARTFILSCTERNEETLRQFLGALRKKYKVQEVEVPEQKHFLWAAEPPVRIFNVQHRFRVGSHETYSGALCPEIIKTNEEN